MVSGRHVGAQLEGQKVILSFLQYWTLSIEQFWFLFLLILNGVTENQQLVLAYDLFEDRRIDNDSARFKFWICTNHNFLLSIATNQFSSFCLDIRSRQCYFPVSQSGEIWNKKAFPYILLYTTKTKD